MPSICFLRVFSSNHFPLTAEGYSIYIRNLPFNFTVSQLEAQFEKFGPIKEGGVQIRYNRVGSNHIADPLSSAWFYLPKNDMLALCSYICSVYTATGILFWFC